MEINPPKCKKCNTEMKIGIAIKTQPDELARCIMHIDRTIKAEDVTIENCWKCPNCGFSEDLKTHPIDPSHFL